MIKILTRFIVWIARVLALVFTLGVLLLLYFNVNYSPVREGKLHLSNAKGQAQLIREAENGIHHIQADSELMAVYTQGFAHAQDRLWQMEKQRRFTQGRLSEIFGPKTIPIDKFSLSIGFRRVAEETWNTPDLIPNDQRAILEAYADGVNDFIQGVGYFHDEITAFYLPPEFFALGIKEI